MAFYLITKHISYGLFEHKLTRSLRKYCESNELKYHDLRGGSNGVAIYPVFFNNYRVEKLGNELKKIIPPSVRGDDSSLNKYLPLIQKTLDNSECDMERVQLIHYLKNLDLLSEKQVERYNKWLTNKKL